MRKDVIIDEYAIRPMGLFLLKLDQQQSSVL